MRRASLLAISLLALAPAPALAQERTARPTPLAAHGATLAWSAPRPDGRFDLVLRTGDGPVAPLPVAPRSVPFDVDLGPDADGRLVATYSRCRREVEGVGGHLPLDYDEGAGCDAYRFDVATGREALIDGVSTSAADETWPTLWRDTVAFVRSYDRRPELPYLYTQRLGRRSVRAPGGPRQVCAGGSCTDRRVSRPYALELWGRRLAFGWTFAGRGEGLDTEVRLDTIGGAHTVVVHQDGGGLTGRALGWPAFEAGRVLFSRACYADTSGCVREAELGRFRIATGTLEGADAPKAVLGHERLGGRTVLLVDEAPGTDCAGDPAVPGGTCVLQRLQPSFRPGFPRSES